MLNNEKGSGLPTVFIMILVLSGLLTTMLQGNLQVAATTNIIDEVNAFNLNSEDYILLAQNELKSYMQENLTILEFSNLGENGDLAKRNEIEDSAIFNGMLDITLVEVYDNFARLYDFSYTDEALTNSKELFVYVNSDTQGIENLGDVFQDQFIDFIENSEDIVVFTCIDNPETCEADFLDETKTNNGWGTNKLKLDNDILFTGDNEINITGHNGRLLLNDQTLLIDGNLTLNDVSLIEGTRFYEGFGIIYVSGDLTIDSWRGLTINNTLIMVGGEVFISNRHWKGGDLEGDNFSIISLTTIDNIVESNVREEGDTYYKYMEEDFFYIGDNSFTSLTTIFEGYGMEVETDALHFYDN